MKEKLINKDNKGITLIALVITIIVLLILAGVTITTLTGDNGIITKTQEAKEKSEIASEKEIIGQAVLGTVSEESIMQFNSNDLQQSLNKITGEQITKVFDIEENLYEVLFINTKRIYKVKSNGQLEENYTTVVKDSLPGNIETDENGNKLDGSIDKPYEINCIEDLVVFSNLTNGKGYKINEDGKIEEITAKESFEEKYVVLNKTLDFKSSASYIDATREDFGDINGDDTDGNTILKEMCSGTGFIPINSFGGYFNGKDNEIKNIYIKRDSDAGLFVGSSAKKIEKLTLSGEITSETGNAYGICRSASLVEKCCNKANINSLWDSINGRAAGICNMATVKECINEGDVYQKGGSAGGISSGCGINIENCTNTGNITANGWYVGGICAGHSNTKTTIKNCNNSGIIKGPRAGGILGCNGKLIENCYNMGNVSSAQYACGITIDATTILNCYNLGEVKGVYSGGIAYEVREKIVNCYNLGTIASARCGGIIGINNSSNLIISNCFNVNIIKCGGAGGSMAGILAINNGNVTINNCYSVTKGINSDVWKKTMGAIIAENSGTVVFNKCYYVEDENLKTAIGGVQDDENVSKYTTKDEITSSILNKNIQEIEHDDEWKEWKDSEEGYPILNI